MLKVSGILFYVEWQREKAYVLFRTQKKYRNIRVLELTVYPQQTDTMLKKQIYKCWKPACTYHVTTEMTQNSMDCVCFIAPYLSLGFCNKYQTLYNFTNHHLSCIFFSFFTIWLHFIFANISGRSGINFTALYFRS